MSVLDRFSPPVAEWFRTTFAEPTAAQDKGWPAIADGDHTLILAPTGSGKTLTAFLSAIDRVMTDPVPDKDRRLRILYVSPLRALAVDVDKNLRAPIKGIQLAAERLGVDVHVPTVGVRTGDTDTSERQRLVRTPPDILITTPESLYLMLTSKARETLRNVDTVIIDEIHAMAGTKRGVHLALTLERLEEEARRGPDAPSAAARSVEREGQPSPATTIAPEPWTADDDPHIARRRARVQRIGLSATQRPLDAIARFLGGRDVDPDEPERTAPRPVTVVDAGITKTLEIEVVVPVEDMSDLGEIVEAPDDFAAAASGPSRKSIWPAVHPRLLDLVLQHRSTLVFVNARRLAERLAAKLNELHHQRTVRQRLAEAGIDPERPGDREAELIQILDAPMEELVKAHHGSLSRERRVQVEDELKSGRLRGLIATSSLELGIDMGAVDLVVQVESPRAVSRGLQRIGRAGHQVGEPSRGKLFPKYRGDLVETAVVVKRMQDGAIEETRTPKNPLDVLAQQIVAMAAMDEWAVSDLARIVRRASPYAELGDEALEATLDLLAGRYPSDEFSELRPRIVWDRTDNAIRPRRGAQRLAVTNPGTIPDRGLFGVFLPDGGRVGELDEEMVHESRPGEVFILGASTWRIEDITHERVVVTPAPGEPGKMPFWHGDGPGRPAELGAAIGAFVRELRESAASDRDGAVATLKSEHALDDWAANNLLAYLDDQLEATGALPDDRTIVVERFRDELGDWRICIHSPFGARVHAPWAMAVEHRLLDRGIDAEILWSDDGIVLRVQEAMDEVPLDDLMIDPDEVRDLVVSQIAGTAMFTTRFREAAGRALLLPRRRPGKRTALWQQRQRAANLLQVAAQYPQFPVTLEATRECLQDVFDLPALEQLLRDLRARKVRLVPVDTQHASPFAQSLLFSWVGTYMYEYDAPLAERRAAALALDRDLLRELLGGDELRELIDPDVLADLELELQLLPEDRRARDPDELHDVLRRLGPMSIQELDARATPTGSATTAGWVDELIQARRAIRVKIADDDRIAAAEDASRLRDALGVALPPGLPAAFTEPVDLPLDDLVSRYARTHGPFVTRDVARRLGISAERVGPPLERLARADRVVLGEFRPGGVEREWVDVEVLRRLRRRSLAALRHEIEPVEGDALARFLPAWHGITGAPRRGIDALAETVGQLQGAPIPASVLERDVLPVRVSDYRPADLDELIAAGEVVWFGVEPLGSKDGRIALCFRDQTPLFAPDPPEEPPSSAVHDAIRAHLASGASFWPDILSSSGIPDQQEVLTALWDLVWAGEVTNDTLGPVRALVSGSGSATTRSRGRPRPGRLRRVGPPPAQGRWSLTTSLREPRPSDTEVATARATQLLERHGVVTGEAVRGEGLRGGFARVYPVLKAMEEAGRVRRGYFVAGLGGAQFAVGGAVDRLRSFRERHGDRGDPNAPPPVLTLAATDPAQPYGASLPWPETDGRPGRTAGGYVVLVDGQLAVYVERGGRSLVTFPPARTDVHWVDGISTLVKDGRLRKLEISKIDGSAALDHPLAETLRRGGFTDGYRGLLHRG